MAGCLPKYICDCLQPAHEKRPAALPQEARPAESVVRVARARGYLRFLLPFFLPLFASLMMR
jgi:hypothetical protein